MQMIQAVADQFDDVQAENAEQGHQVEALREMVQAQDDHLRTKHDELQVRHVKLIELNEDLIDRVDSLLAENINLKKLHDNLTAENARTHLERAKDMCWSRQDAVARGWYVQETANIESS